MQYVTTLAEEISDKLIQVLDLAEKSNGFHCPPYFLGPEPEPPAPAYAWEQSKKVYSDDEGSVAKFFQFQGPDSILSIHMEELLKQAGKTRADLTQAEYDVLKHSGK